MVKIVAEIGNTHEGSVGLAKCIIKAAADCGVDAVKFQTHIFAAESCRNAPNPPYFSGESRKDYFERTAFDRGQLVELKSYAEQECNVEFFSSPFSLEAVELLDQIGMKTYKVPSGEVTNIPFLERLGRLQKTVVLSSGMSDWAELDTAVEVLRSSGCRDLIVLQCTSEYPCPPDQAGLNVMVEMKERYQCSVGFSDHTLGVGVPIAAVVMGAEFIEKHFTLSQSMYGSDAKNSTEPAEFSQLVREIRAVSGAIHNQIDKDQKAADLVSMKKIFEKSIVSSREIPAGSVLQLEDLAFKKPGGGLQTKFYRDLIGKTLKRDLTADEPFKREYFE